MTKYLELYERLRQDIIDRIYVPGDKLPSKRVMAADSGYSVITVEHAYELLAQEGYILPMEKSGYFVSFNEDNTFASAITVTRRYDKSERSAMGREVTSQESDEEAFSFNIYARTVRRVLSEYSEELMIKAPAAGSLKLREAIADYLVGNRRIRVTPEQIYIGAGAEYLYGLIVQALGREYIYGVESPSYNKISLVYEAEGVKLDMLPLTDDGIESKALWKSKATVLHITPYRSFPSGVTATAAKKREYVRWALDREGYIIEDDFESEFTPSRKPEETIFSLDTDDRVIYVNTFTRTIGPSVRIAYMVIPEGLMKCFEEKIGFYSCPVPVLEQYTVASLIENGDFVRHINRVRRHRR